jgi:hypothetical protein
MKPADLQNEIALKIAVCLAVIASLAGCGGAPGSANHSGPTTLTVLPEPGSVPVNGTVTFTAVTTNATVGPVWTLSPTLFGGNLGTLSSPVGNTVIYTAPPVPPVYGPLNQPGSSVQGMVILTVSASNNGFDAANTQISFAITAPEVTTGIAPATAIMALGASKEFYGGSIGNPNNGVTWEVNGFTGGTNATGTITNQGYYPAGGGDYVWPGTYTAPAKIPATGNSVTITVVSQADPAKSSSAAVTLQ